MYRAMRQTLKVIIHHSVVILYTETNFVHPNSKACQLEHWKGEACSFFLKKVLQFLEISQDNFTKNFIQIHINLCSCITLFVHINANTNHHLMLSGWLTYAHQPKQALILAPTAGQYAPEADFFVHHRSTISV